MNPVDAALAKARENAANLVPDTGSNTMPMLPPSNSGPSLYDFAAPAGLVVSAFAKVHSPTGMTLKDPRLPFTECEGTINLSDLRFMHVIRVTVGGMTTFATTYDLSLPEDRQMAKSGRKWLEEVAEAKKLDPTAKPYKSAEVPLKLTKPIIVKGTTIAEEGDVIGFSLSITNFKYFTSFVNDLRLANVPENAIVSVRAVHQINENKGKPSNGVVVFEYLGPSQLENAA